MEWFMREEEKSRARWWRNLPEKKEYERIGDDILSHGLLLSALTAKLPTENANMQQLF
jgi:hypothetical protein